MIKNIKKVLNFLTTERIFKIMRGRYNQHLKKYPNLAGFTFDVLSLKVSLSGRFENDELIILEKEVFSKIDCSNSSCLDIGANIGNHSVFFASFFHNVDCFEPQPDNYYLLKFNSRKFDNIRTFSFGSSDIDEEKYIYTHNEADTGSSTIENTKNFNDMIKVKNKDKIKSKFKVKLKNLDNFLNNNKLKKISFIKIDVEGNEYKSLVGLKNTIVQDSPIIALEQLEDQFDKVTKKTDSIEFLRQNNYNFFYEPIFYKRKRSKNKIINAINKLIFLLQMTFNLKKNNQYSLKKIENFEIAGYSMILASKIDIMNIKVSASGS